MNVSKAALLQAALTAAQAPTKHAASTRGSLGFESSNFAASFAHSLVAAMLSAAGIVYCRDQQANRSIPASVKCIGLFTYMTCADFERLTHAVDAQLGLPLPSIACLKNIAAVAKNSKTIFSFTTVERESSGTAGTAQAEAGSTADRWWRLQADPACVFMLASPVPVAAFT